MNVNPTQTTLKNWDKNIGIPYEIKLGKPRLPLTVLQILQKSLFAEIFPRYKNLDSRVRFLKGNPSKLGAETKNNSVNFAIHSTSDSMKLYIYDDPNGEPLYTYELDKTINKTNSIWHVLVTGLPSKTLYYCYRNERSPNPILDPYAKGVFSRKKYGIGEKSPEDSSYHPMGVIVSGEKNSFNWEQDDVRIRHDKKDLIIYEMHVRGFTADPSSGVKSPGTFAGIIEKIDYLKSLGVNAIELQPIHEFDEMQFNNSWGYMSANFFSLFSRYGSNEDPQELINEFKTMVKELHKNGIEVILDVVFNHTGESNEKGPTYSFKALDNSAYYILDADGHYVNKSGCGNTLNCNNPITKQMIIDSLKYWVTEMHIDGFRFDLASILAGDEHGHPIKDTLTIIKDIASEPVLAKTKLIAEPWDPETQLSGAFTSTDPRWQEWNEKFRDSARRFISGDSCAKGAFASTLCGSNFIFEQGGGTASNSINFITAHDGFTLNDLVSYNQKQNATGGCEHNYSWNCGAEGVTDKEDVLRSRRQQMRNLHLALLTATGVPMVLMGDEYGHSKNGNNNTYNEDFLNHFHWDKISDQDHFKRFFSLVNQYRMSHKILRKGQFLQGKDIEWHGMKHEYAPNWNDSFLAYTLKDDETKEAILLAFNPSDTLAPFILPPPPYGKKWHLVVNTSERSPKDFLEEGETRPLDHPEFKLFPYSSIMLEAK